MVATESGDTARHDFERLVQAHRGQWTAAADRIVRNLAEAEDVVQDTLVAVWRRWEQIPPDKPAAYVLRAVRLNSIKRRSRRSAGISVDRPDDLPAAPPASEPMDPVMLERAIEGLPAHQQAVLRAKFYLGWTFPQIGRSMSISANTAASRCRYALAALRKTLKGK